MFQGGDSAVGAEASDARQADLDATIEISDDSVEMIETSASTDGTPYRILVEKKEKTEEDNKNKLRML